MDIADKLKNIVESACKAVAEKLSLDTTSEVVLDIPKDRRLADLSTNIAMQICKGRKGLKPIEIAQDIVSAVKLELAGRDLDKLIDRVETRMPGFINFHYSDLYLCDVINDIKKDGTDFGRSQIGKGTKVLVEFVSANPTGPLSVAHGRQAAVGDVLCNILEFAGYDVRREYYLNDEGNQIDILGKSIYARYCELLGESEVFPENGYRGKYIYDIAKAIIEDHGNSLLEDDEKALAVSSSLGAKYIMDSINKDLLDFGVGFDNYFSQHELGESGNVEKAIDSLKEKGFIYESDGAVWFKSTEFGDDKDRVIRKSDGNYTYLTPDIAYHEDKFSRGFDWLIDLWGPDHHGYILRLKASSLAFGRGKDALMPLIIQLATISRGGRPVRMSTREGEFITLREVIDEVGKDVARFFFLMRRKDSHLDFDLELAKKQSMDNPVYYIQYAHARICGILEYEDKQEHSAGKKADINLLKSKEEVEILRTLREFQSIVEWSARNFEPHMMIQYLMDLAKSFHSFYTQHRVVSDDKQLTAARLVLMGSLKTVFSKSLDLLGVSCPEKM